VLHQRQLGLSAQGHAVAADQRLHAGAVHSRQADAAGLEELQRVALHQQQSGIQLGDALPGLAPAKQLQVERRQHLARGLGLAPALRRAAVIGEQGIEMLLQALHHIGAMARPKQRHQQQRRPPLASGQPHGPGPRRLLRQVQPGAEGQAERGVFEQLQRHGRPSCASSILPGRCRLYADLWQAPAPLKVAASSL
jgi:hypothetical protein